MANFSPIFQKTEQWEGGYQAYSSDVANYTSSGKLVGTNRGISAIAYQQYLGYEPSISDMKAITREIAENVYRKLFWDKIRGDEIKDQDVADIIFATYIGNPSASNKIVAKALVNTGSKVGTVSTPYSNTIITAINRSNQRSLFYAIKEEKRLFLESLRSKYPQFINGWMRKLNSFEYGGKRKWWLVAIVFVAFGVAGYYAYEKGYYQKIKKYIK